MTVQAQETIAIGIMLFTTMRFNSTTGAAKLLCFVAMIASAAWYEHAKELEIAAVRAECGTK